MQAEGASGENRGPRGALSRFETAFGSGAGDSPELDPEARPLDPDAPPPDPDAPRVTRVRVDDGGVKRPFMRGILVRSLTERGISFEHAYDIAEGVWRRVRDRALVTRLELAMLVHELASGEEPLEPRTRSRRRTDPLTVLGKDGRWPFNQARLQQSLLAAGVEPLVAFQAAVDIEQELRDRGDAELTRDDIRGLADRMLRRRDGVAAADRYLAWRSYQNEDDRPLILLLGGTSGVGKSSLAVEVARRLGIGRVLSTDSIRDVMRMMLSEELVPTLHVSSFEAHTRLLTRAPEGIDPVIEGFLDQSRTVSVGVRAVIERAIVEGTSTILDGVSLVPGLFDPADWSDRAHIFFLLAADADRESLHSHLVARAHGKGARASERYVRNFSEICTIQEALLERSEAYSVPVVDVHDRDAAALDVVKHVVGHLRRQRAAEASKVD